MSHKPHSQHTASMGHGRRAGHGEVDTRQRLNSTFEQTAVGLTHTDFEGRFLHVNRRFCRLLGYEQAEVLAMAPGQLTHPEDRGLQGPAKAKLLREETESISREKRYLHKDGRVVWVRSTMSLARDQHGKPTHFVGVIEDISDRKQVEEYYRATVEHAPVGIMHTGLDKSTLQVNRKLCEMLGYSKAELLQLQSKDLVAPGEYGAEHLQFEKLNRGEIDTFVSERPLRRKDGQIIWVSRTVSAVRDSAGVPLYYVRVMADITDRKQAQDAMMRDHTLLRTVVDNLPDRIYVKDSAGRYLLMNEAAMRFRGITGHSDVIGKTAYSIMPPHAAARIEAEDQVVITSRKPIFNREQRVMSKRDEADVALWHMTTKVPLQDEAGHVVGIVGVNRDITEQKRAALALMESEQKFRQLAENIPEVFWITDAAQHETIYISAAFEKITGQPAAVLRQRAGWLRLVHKDDRRRVFDARKALPHGEYNIEYRLIRPDGEVRWIHDQAFPVFDGEDRAYRIAGIAADITQRKVAEEKLIHLAHYDALTGLPNRVLFNDRVKLHMAQAQRRGELVAVLVLGLDRFKVANDTLGQAVGDELLKQVSQRLSASVRKADTVARLSGDEFGLVLSGVVDGTHVNTAAQKLLETLALPFSINGYELFVTASIGISLYPADGEDEQTLIKSADTAMCRAKEMGRNNVQFYAPEMNRRTLHRLEMESGLRRAVERGEFLLHYQPKVDLTHGEITGFEALLRWQRPANAGEKASLVSPAEFVPLLEETGLIVPVGEWIIDAACAQISAWRRAGVEPRPIAINLSARQFTDRKLAEVIKRALQVHLVESYLLELEITESSLMNNTEQAIATLNELKALGLNISIDDFGTGYSSLSYLKRFPLDALKVDRSFVRDITTDTDDAAITLAIISMAHSLGLKVIAEGVETEAQLAFLAAHGCEQMQGYFFSRPVPAADCSLMLREGRRLKLPPMAGDAAAGAAAIEPTATLHQPQRQSQTQQPRLLS